MDLYIHPSVTSFITDNSQIYTTSQGLTTLFCPHFCIKGKDNVLQVVDGPSDDDYISKYGEPNFVEYGQAQLNFIKWLKSKGSGIGMRITPHDAKYAHAVLCFHVKTIDDGIKVWQYNGEDVTRKVDSITDAISFVLPDGTTKDSNGDTITTETQLSALGCTVATKIKKLVRTRTKVITGGASDYDEIDTYVEKNDNIVLDDGYTQYILGYFVVDGRGADYYNNLRFSISLNTDYDDTYDFRIYDIGLYYKNTDGSYSSIDSGPYMVSFDRYSMDLSRESMFIEDVLERYGKEIYFKLNEDGFDELGEELNSEVDPALQDFFFLQERELSTEAVDDDGNPIVIHGNNIIGAGVTQLSADVAVGATEIYVQDPSVIYPESRILIGNIEYKTVDEVNIVSGKITLTSAIVGNLYETESIVSGQVEDEYSQVAVDISSATYPTDTITVSEILSEGRQKLVEGEAWIIVDSNDEVENEIISIDTENDIIKFAEEVDFSSATLVGIRQYNKLSVDNSDNIDFDNYIAISGGDEGYHTTPDGGEITTTNDKINMQTSLLIQAYTGELCEDILQKKFWRFDVTLDANYPDSVKEACNQLASVMRKDHVFIYDLGFTASPDQAIEKRNKLGLSNFYCAGYSQDIVIDDSYSGRKIKVTMPYKLAEKIPSNDIANGLHYAFAGPKRGIVSGFENLSWNPSPAWEERLYKAQVNYTLVDPKRTMIYGNLTSQTVNSSLSDLSHVRPLLRIQREVEDMMGDYIFDIITDRVLNQMTYDLNRYLTTWIENDCFESCKGLVYSTDYDKKRKIARVKIECVFTSVLERIIINFIIN